MGLMQKHGERRIDCEMWETEALRRYVENGALVTMARGAGREFTEYLP